MNHSKPRLMSVGGSITNSPGDTAFEFWTAELARTELASCNESNRLAAKTAALSRPAETKGMRTVTYHLDIWCIWNEANDTRFPTGIGNTRRRNEVFRCGCSTSPEF